MVLEILETPGLAEVLDHKVGIEGLLAAHAVGLHLLRENVGLGALDARREVTSAT
jgi:hypothetical protein